VPVELDSDNGPAPRLSVPGPAYPHLGVHLTPPISGDADLGPNALLVLARKAIAGAMYPQLSWPG